MRSSVVLLEVIISLVLFSLLAFGTMEFLFSMRKGTYDTSFSLTNLLKLESTKMFLTHNNDLSKLQYTNGSLFYSGDLLLDKVSSFQRIDTIVFSAIDICIQDDRICQHWKIKR